MFWVGSPYLMRDKLAWAYADERRARILFGIGAAFGALLLFLGLFVY
jgi:hypothetical protein